MIKNLLLVLVCLIAFKASGQQYVVYGRLTDQRKQPIPFASIYISHTTYGSTSNESGMYQFKLNPGTYAIVYRIVGYKEQVIKVTVSNHNILQNVSFQDEPYQLKEVAIRGRYAKDTTADDIMRKVIAKRQYYLNEVKAYSCAVYVKGVQRLSGAPKALLGRPVRERLDLDSVGRGILYQSESLSDFSYEQPNKVNEVTIASKTVGLNPTFSYNKASDLQVNFYNNIFYISGLSSHGFLSPAAATAFSLYRYHFLGRITENGHVIDKIQVIPRHEHTPTFKGDIYILEGDWRIYSVNLYLTNQANELNFIDTLTVQQQYIPITDNIWEPVSTQYSFSGDVLGFKFGGYYNAIYNNYNLDPKFPDHYFTGEILRYDTAATAQSNAYWAANRPVPLTRQETRDYFEKDSLAKAHNTKGYRDSLQRANNRLLVLPYLIFGHSSTYKDGRDSLYFYPFIQTFFYNTVEGYGINLQAKYTHQLNDIQSYDVTPDVRFGTSNKKLTANINGDYNYDPFHNSKFYGGFGSDILDLNNVGTRSVYFNTLSTLFSERNYVKYYESEYVNGGWQREITNGVLFNTSLTWSNRIQLFNTSYNHVETFSDRAYTSNNPLMPNAPADDRSILFPENKALTFFASMQFTFDQQYITRPTTTIYLPSKYPQVTVSYREGINNVLGSDVNYNFASLNIAQANIPIGLAGYSSFQVTAGDFFNRNRLYFMDYYHFLGNQGTTFDPTYVGSFHFLPFYTFSTDNAFLEAHYQHNFSGTLFNKISFLRDLKLDEIVGANYLDEKGNMNYTEFYVGIQRLIFRIDYGMSYEGNKKYMQGFKIFYGIR
jgi:hypothetical protein